MKKKLLFKGFVVVYITFMVISIIYGVKREIEKREQEVNIKVHVVDQEQVWTDLGIVNFDDLQEDHEYGFCRRVDDNTMMLYDKTAGHEAMDKCRHAAFEILDEF